MLKIRLARSLDWKSYVLKSFVVIFIWCFNWRKSRFSQNNVKWYVWNKWRSWFHVTSSASASTTSAYHFHFVFEGVSWSDEFSPKNCKQSYFANNFDVFTDRLMCQSEYNPPNFHWFSHHFYLWNFLIILKKQLFQYWKEFRILVGLLKNDFKILLWRKSWVLPHYL